MDVVVAVGIHSNPLVFGPTLLEESLRRCVVYEDFFASDEYQKRFVKKMAILVDILATFYH